MRILTWLAPVGLAVGFPAAAQEAPQFALEDIDFTPDCVPNAAFNRLIHAAVRIRQLADGAARPDEPLHSAVTGDTHHVLHLDRAADWHGLHLVEIRADFGIERAPANHVLVFADSPDRVREAWNARGWDLPAAGQTRAIDDEVQPASIGVGTDGALATVTCFRD